jgi:hypothetical protein
MGESFVVADQNRYPARVRFCGRLITILEIRISAPKQGQLHPFAEERRDVLEKDIQSLLPGQSAHHSQERGVWGWIKTKPALKAQFIRRTGLKFPVVGFVKDPSGVAALYLGKQEGQGAGLHGQGWDWMVAHRLQPDQEAARYSGQPEVEADKTHQDAEGDVGGAEVLCRRRIPRNHAGRLAAGQFI